jgi:two-component system, chemotaxis family, sensor kinase Cph1
MLLQPLDATGAALFHDGEIQTAGEVPSTPELRALREWVDGRLSDGLFSSHAVARDEPSFGALTRPPAACWRCACRRRGPTT